MDINLFAKKIIPRDKSFFQNDIISNYNVLSENIENSNVLVIGGAGTIGSNFIKALLKFNPKKVLVIDINENELTELIRDLRSSESITMPNEFYTYPISFSSNIFSKIFNNHGPFEIVANFAAHKHVRSEKDIFSIEALLENNLFQAKDLLEMLLQEPPKHFFCVSTDKAANPVNIMGASKKLMEDMILSYSKHIKISTARFANVAFSNGSLLYGFVMRMSKAQPLSCPIDVKRFFVTPEEAGEICMLACILGESGEIYFPKMEKENNLINFSEILKLYLNDAGFEPYLCNTEQLAKSSMKEVHNGKYPVYSFYSNTNGEKLYEEFYTDNEMPSFNKFDSLGVIKKTPTFSIVEIDQMIIQLRSIFNSENPDKIKIINALKNYIPEFEHIETGLNLDNKM